jgi:hypothetical protein
MLRRERTVQNSTGTTVKDIAKQFNEVQQEGADRAAQYRNDSAGHCRTVK